MKTRNPNPQSLLRAFTLIELLVVIAIIGILAGLLFPAGAAIKRNATIKKAKTELRQLSLAIDSYKAKLGYYPPGPGGLYTMSNSLYFELSGATLTAATGGNFVTLDGAGQIPQAAMQATFGQGGVLNTTKGGADDNGLPAEAFIKGLKPNQYADLANGVRILKCSVDWPKDNGEAIAGYPFINPWRYVVSGATNNPGTYDLWVDVILSGKTNRISNWSDNPEIVP